MITFHVRVTLPVGGPVTAVVRASSIRVAINKRLGSMPKRVNGALAVEAHEPSGTRTLTCPRCAEAFAEQT